MGYREAVLATTPVAYWRLGESSGTTAFDSSGNGHDGTYTNGPTLGQPGLIVDPDTAVSFDGSNDYVAVTQHADLKLPGEMSVQAWIKPTALVNADIVRQGVTANTQYDIVVTATGVVQFLWYDGVFKSVSSPTGTVAAGSIHHLVATRDASLFIRVYVNGVQVASGQGTAPTVDPPAMQIGGVTARFFNGTIDEVAVWSRALTPDEVKSLAFGWSADEVGSLLLLGVGR